MLSIQPIPAYDDNYIWLLWNDSTRRAYVVDPGDAAPVMTALSDLNLELEGILITHHHFDHVGGVSQLRERFEPVVYGPVNPTIEGIDHRLKAGDDVFIGKLHLDVPSPGKDMDYIFMGATRIASRDSAGQRTCGRQHP